MKKLTCLMTYFLTLVTTAALALDLTPYETRARKDTVANSAQIVTDVDMAGVGNAVQVELDGKTAPAGVSNIVTAAMSNRTVTVNGQSGALNSNLVFEITTTNRVTALHDSQSASYFQTVENGTGTVWRVTGPFTNVMVTLSADFMETGGSTRPVWTNNVFPFTDGSWSGLFGFDNFVLLGAGDSGWSSNNQDVPALLSPGQNAQGTATVSFSDVYYVTNLYTAFATTGAVQTVSSDLAILRQDFDGYHPPTTDVVAAVTPSTLTIYGANSITNETGFGAFLSTNNAANVNIVAVDPVAGQVIASYLYRVTADHVVEAATLSHHLSTSGGVGTSDVATVIQVFSGGGSSLSSNSIASFRKDTGLVSSTNIVASFVLPYVASGGVVRVSIVETIGSTRDVTARAGGKYPMVLTMNAVPIPYATPDELGAKVDEDGGSANNLSLTGAPTLNGENLLTSNQFAAVCSNQCIRAWMPLTSQSAYGYADLTCASNSMALLGPAPLNSFVIRPLIPSAASGSDVTFSNIVFYCDRASTDPRASQGFASITTGVFTINNWGLASPKGYIMRRTDAMMSFGTSRRNIAAYSLGIAGSSLRLMCLWSPATPAELADADGIIDYGSDAQ